MSQKPEWHEVNPDFLSYFFFGSFFFMAAKQGKGVGEASSHTILTNYPFFIVVKCRAPQSQIVTRNTRRTDHAPERKSLRSRPSPSPVFFDRLKFADRSRESVFFFSVVLFTPPQSDRRSAASGKSALLFVGGISTAQYGSYGQARKLCLRPR